MKKTTLALFLLVSISSFAQTFQWVKPQPINFSSNPDMIGFTTACDAAGNVYASGFKENTFLYDQIYGDVFYNKYNASGDLLFSKTIGGHATVFDMLADPQDNIIMVAAFVNTISIGDFTIDTVDQGVQNLLLKFDSQGNLLWHMQLQIGDSLETRMHALTVDSNGNIYVGYYDFQHSAIQKLSPQGEVLLTIAQQYARAISSLSIDNAGNIYAAGSCADPGATYAGVLMPAPFQYNTFIVKYSAQGVYQWVRYVEDITCPDPQVVGISPDEVYFSSMLFGNYTFDGIPTEGPLSMFSDVFITRLNADGIFQWVREVPGATGMLYAGSRRNLSADPQGNICLAGSMRGTVSWNSSTTTIATGFSNDAIIVKFSPQGELLLAKTAGGASGDRFDAVTFDAAGNAFLVGMCQGNALFDTIEQQADPFQHWPFIAKLPAASLGMPSQQFQGAGLYPNPASDFMYLNSKTPLRGSIFNMLGQKIMDFSIADGQPVAISHLAKATYLVQIEDAKTFKLIKN